MRVRGVSVRVCGMRHVSMVYEGCECERCGCERCECEGWDVRHVVWCMRGVSVRMSVRDVGVRGVSVRDVGVRHVSVVYEGCDGNGWLSVYIQQGGFTFCI